MRNTEWLDRWEYPFAPHYFETTAGRIHYVDEGEGAPVLMVHGTPTWSFLYRRLIKDLSRDHRVIAADNLGFGLSDKPEGWSYLAGSFRVDVADELHLPPLPAPGLQRQVFVPEITRLLQLAERGLARRLITEEADFPKLLAQKFVA
jgi:pimeloyl-ACP methyl ester carboxylesterase